MRKYLAIFTAGFLSLPAMTMAQLSAEDTGLEATGTEVYGTLDLTIGEWVGQRIIAPVLTLVGVIFLVLMIYAGFLWMTARGKEDQVTKAKDLMTRAVIGVIILAAAYAITDFIFSALA